jgi:hypothetical protein
MGFSWNLQREEVVWKSFMEMVVRVSFLDPCHDDPS